MTDSALKVAKNPLTSNKNFPGIMNVEADLLDGVCNVRPGEGQVLKSSHKAAVGCRIINRRADISRHFGTSVDRGRAWFTVAHAMSSENVQSVLTL